jgi:predicted RNA-binding Zn-ribbon protein involved in translation (DUF1610 family)
LSVSRRCEVCGGRVRPTDQQSNFGFCEKCGIVYALRARATNEWGEEMPRSFEGDFGKGREEPSRSKVSASEDTGELARASAFLWRCPDCDSELRAANDTDLGFLKREHIREYHPNR